MAATSGDWLRRTVATAAIGGAALIALPAVAGADVDDQTQAFKPVKSSKRAVVFRPRRVDVSTVVDASVQFKLHRASKVVERRRGVSLERVKRSIERGKRLHVKKPRSARRGRLLIRARGERAGDEQPSASPSCSYGSFSAVSPPGACWRPYSDTSPFNRGLPPEPALVSSSSAIVSRTLGLGSATKGIEAGDADTPDDWNHPIYFSGPSDPVYTVHCLEDWGTCEVEGMQVRIPDAARPAGGGDAHMAVIDQASGWEYDFWQVESKPAGGGTISIAWGGRTAIGTADADGLGSNATAAHFGLAAGVIRASELEAGRINHALFMIVKCTNGDAVWPAEEPSGTPCSKLGLPNDDAPALGQHFFLDMSDQEIDRIDAPAWKKAIMRAMADYGMFVGDTGGNGFHFLVESGSSSTSFGLADPLVEFAQRAPGVTSWGSGTDRKWLFGLDGIDWSRLRVAQPCIAAGSC